jgi:hypothetical protein
LAWWQRRYKSRKHSTRCSKRSGSHNGSWASMTTQDHFGKPASGGRREDSDSEFDVFLSHNTRDKPAVQAPSPERQPGSSGGLVARSESSRSCRVTLASISSSTARADESASE